MISAVHCHMCDCGGAGEHFDNSPSHIASECFTNASLFPLGTRSQHPGAITSTTWSHDTLQLSCALLSGRWRGFRATMFHQTSYVGTSWRKSLNEKGRCLHIAIEARNQPSNRQEHLPPNVPCKFLEDRSTELLADKFASRFSPRLQCVKG